MCCGDFISTVLSRTVTWLSPLLRSIDGSGSKHGTCSLTPTRDTLHFLSPNLRSSRLLSLRRNQKDLKIRQERSPLLKLLQDWTQVKCCARMSGIVWVCKQVASGAALVGSCFQLREGKKTLKTSLHTSNFARNILTFIASTKQCQKQRHRFSGGEKHLCDNARFL